MTTEEEIQATCDEAAQKALKSFLGTQRAHLYRVTVNVEMVTAPPPTVGNIVEFIINAAHLHQPTATVSTRVDTQGDDNEH